MLNFFFFNVVIVENVVCLNAPCAKSMHRLPCNIYVFPVITERALGTHSMGYTHRWERTEKNCLMKIEDFKIENGLPYLKWNDLIKEQWKQPFNSSSFEHRFNNLISWTLSPLNGAQAPRMTEARMIIVSKCELRFLVRYAYGVQNTPWPLVRLSC